MNLEYLRHGKALCGKVFRRFVETFNFHNDFVSNLKGDADLPVVGGKLHLDRTDERHPVIRCQGCGKGGGGDGGSNPAPFDIEADETGTKSVVRCRFYWGEDGIELSDFPLDGIPQEGASTLYLTRTGSEGEPVFELTTDAPVDGDDETAYFKIYDFTDGEVSCDYRSTFLSLGGGGINVIGTDETHSEDVKELTVASGEDSNVKAVVASDENGKATLTIDVYYV